MLKQINKLMLGNGLAQLLQFGSILILSRIYQPSDFGMLAAIQSFAMIGSIVITMQLHLTIPLSSTEDVALRTVQNVQKLCLVLFLMALLPFIWLGEILTYALFLSFLLGLTNTYTGYLIYRGNFGQLSIFYIFRSLFLIIVQIAFALLEIENGLVIATLFGEALSASYLRLKKIPSLGDRQASLNSIKALIHKSKPFSLHGTIQEIVSVSAFYAPILLFTYKYGEDIGGQYAMASRLTWAPVVLVSSSVAQVLSHSYGKKHLNGTLDLTWHLRPMVVLIIAFLCLFAFAAQPIFHSLLGEPWEMASQMLPMQMLWGAAFIMSTPFRVASRVLRLQYYQLVTDALILAAVVTVILSFAMPPIVAMWWIVGLSFLQHTGFSFAIWRFNLINEASRREYGAD